MKQKIVIATNNLGKVKEFKELFADENIEIISQADMHVPEVEETGLTFVENAILKVRNACAYTNLPAIGDDSGLVVDALEGRPGIYSSRYVREKASQEEKINRLLEELKNVPQEKRTARFYCVLVVMKNKKDPAPIISQGIWEGFIAEEPKGKNGFGFDPVFFVPSENCMSAELDSNIKNKLSHRGQAMVRLIELMK